MSFFSKKTYDNIEEFADCTHPNIGIYLNYINFVSSLQRECGSGGLLKSLTWGVSFSATPTGEITYSSLHKVSRTRIVPVSAQEMVNISIEKLYFL